MHEKLIKWNGELLAENCALREKVQDLLSRIFTLQEIVKSKTKNKKE